MSTAIVGLGEWVPETVRGNDAWPRAFIDAMRDRTAKAHADFTSVPANKRNDDVDQIVARLAAAETDDPFLGAKRRRIADRGMTAHEAEARAARAAVEDAGIDPLDVGAVLSSAAVPDRITPPTGAYVAHAIGAKRAFAAGLDAVCASAVVGLEMAMALIDSGRTRYVLLTQSHLMTRTFPMMHPVSPNVGDAATAIIVGKVERGGVRSVCSLTNGAYFDAVVWRRPKDADTPWWEPGGTMAMGSYDSPRARELIENTVRIGADALREAADVARMPLRDLDLLASVQPRRWIPPAIAETAGARAACAVDTFDERAHLGCCGVVTNLLAARREGRLARGARVALYGQGAGFTRAAAIVEWG
jgi:3-oxoacyl-[acyl-carrier-protein] synthase-3